MQHKKYIGSDSWTSKGPRLGSIPVTAPTGVPDQ